ncbi:MAG TPA: hypothetical protein VHV82_23165 [Sporichthyaceae bacterium]|jgi:hypothetical protein|nr:hypothetical protein [Sporichthyaceae bacterium]
MRNSVRFGAIAVAAAAATSLAALPAGAASADGAPPAVPVHHAAHHHHHHLAALPPAPPPLGTIVICNHSGYLFNVFADGPSVREDDLAGSFDECSNWDKVLTGNYQIGFGLRTTSTQNVIIQARFKRDDHVFYKVFNNEGIIQGFVNKDETMRIDLFIPQG